MASILPEIILVASTAAGNMSPVEVEKAYWDCESLAAQGMLTLDDGADCSEIYEHLKAEKFGGDFHQFLAWWQENKKQEMSSRMKTNPLRGQQ
jgi:hypothetical protein